MEQINLSESEWRKRLTPEQYHVLREAGTERPFAGKYDGNKADGIYRCAGCQLDLFDSIDKFDSGSGWPSFTQPIEAENVVEHKDQSHGMVRVETRCARCDDTRRSREVMSRAAYGAATRSRPAGTRGGRGSPKTSAASVTYPRQVCDGSSSATL